MFSIIRDELRNLIQHNEASIEFRNDIKCGALFDEYWRSLTA